MIKACKPVLFVIGMCLSLGEAANSATTYKVTGISSDYLNMRSVPSTRGRILHRIPRDFSELDFYDECKKVGSINWCLVGFRGDKGWVSKEYIAPVIVESQTATKPDQTYKKDGAEGKVSIPPTDQESEVESAKPKPESDIPDKFVVYYFKDDRGKTGYPTTCIKTRSDNALYSMKKEKLASLAGGLGVYSDASTSVKYYFYTKKSICDAFLKKESSWFFDEPERATIPYDVQP